MAARSGTHQGSHRTHYEVLRVATDAPAATIRQAYRKCAIEHHPDKNGGEGHEEFVLIGQAYAVLSNPTTRRQYDRDLAYPPRSASSHPPSASTSWDDFFSGRPSRPARPASDTPTRAEATYPDMSFEDVVRLFQSEFRSNSVGLREAASVLVNPQASTATKILSTLFMGAEMYLSYQDQQRANRRATDGRDS
ncbi:DnaJ domain-containing protein [Phlyctochytrium arcticum]|nr:DnaJ domain-containing protein [Phlyctochytrium arcticum]